MGREPGQPEPAPARALPASKPAPARSKVVALRYARPARSSAGAPASGGGGGAPEVVASGRGAIAERILELAGEHGVPVREDRDLVELLSTCEVGEQIPVEVWTAVAELLTWVWALGDERDPS